MLNLPYRIELLGRLGEYMAQPSDEWEATKQRATTENPWFVQQFVTAAVDNIVNNFLSVPRLQQWLTPYQLPTQNVAPKRLGIVMAGNIPLVGFHDFLCAFVVGHPLLMKPSTKDSVLIKHLVGQLVKWEPRLAEVLQFAERLNGCDAYIATGSNNTGRYFEYYFRNHPHIIRQNRTSVAVLSGHETQHELDLLVCDMLLYFGQGCRSVSKLYVPHGYNFEQLLHSMHNYKWMAEHAKFKNNYDYNLAILLLNHQYYMTNGVLLLVENEALFSPLAVVNYEFYSGPPPSTLQALHPTTLQMFVGQGGSAFGSSQQPRLHQYADGVDTLAFLSEL